MACPNRPHTRARHSNVALARRHDSRAHMNINPTLANKDSKKRVPHKLMLKNMVNSGYSTDRTIIALNNTYSSTLFVCRPDLTETVELLLKIVKHSKLTMSRTCRHTTKHGRHSGGQNVQIVQAHHKTRKLSHPPLCCHGWCSKNSSSVCVGGQIVQYVMALLCSLAD